MHAGLLCVSSRAALAGARAEQAELTSPDQEAPFVDETMSP